MVQTWMRTLAVVLVSKGTTLLSAPNTILLVLSPVPDEESKVPGDLPIRNLGVQHFLSIDRANRGRLGTEGVEPPELSLHLLRRLRVNFLPSLTGDCNIEGDCSRGSSYFLLGY